MTNLQLKVHSIHKQAEFPMANGANPKKDLFRTTLRGNGEDQDISVVINNRTDASTVVEGGTVKTRGLHNMNVRDQAGRPVFRLAGPYQVEKPKV